MFVWLSDFALGHLLLSRTAARALTDVAVLDHCLTAGRHLCHTTLIFLLCLSNSRAWCLNSSSSPLCSVALASSEELHTSNSQWLLLSYMQ